MSLRLRYRPDDDEESHARRVNPTEIMFVQLLFLVIYIILLLCIIHRFKYTYVHYNSVASSALVKYAIVILYTIHLRTHQSSTHTYIILNSRHRWREGRDGNRRFYDFRCALCITLYYNNMHNTCRMVYIVIYYIFIFIFIFISL